MEAKMNNWSGWAEETRPDVLYSRYKSILEESGFTICSECAHFFRPYGFTVVFVLAESHFAIHTFPEKGKSYLELSSCVDGPFQNFIKFVANPGGPE